MKAAAPSSFSLKIPIEKCEPCDWNPNVMPAEYLYKLEEGIKQVLAQSGRIPPITVRKHPEKKDKYQIIDGYHRWMVFKKLKLETIDAFVLEVDDAMARTLTAMLNYVRGEADPEKYPILIAEILASKSDLTYRDLAMLLPESEEYLEELVAGSEAALNILDAAPPPTGGDGPEEPLEDRWVNLNFAVPLEVAGIIEKELDRIANHLSGKNRRIRALEYAFINSALTPMEDAAKTIDTEEKKRGAGKEEEKPKVRDAGFTPDVVKELKKSAAKKPTRKVA